jgi:hypothetical protein
MGRATGTGKRGLGPARRYQNWWKTPEAQAVLRSVPLSRYSGRGVRGEGGEGEGSESRSFFLTI